MRSLKTIPVPFDTEWEIKLPPAAIPVRIQYENHGPAMLVLANWKTEERESVTFFTAGIGPAVIPDDVWPVGCFDVAQTTYAVFYRMTRSMLTRVNVDLLDAPEGDAKPGILDYALGALDIVEGKGGK